MADDLVHVSFCLNDEETSFEVRSEEMLIDVLRERAGLTGTKLSCDLGACGACTVLLDGKPAASCSTFAWQAAESDVRTIEGLAGANGELDPVQTAFVDHSSFQCGYCTPGMIMLARALLDENPSPMRDDIRQWMGANICRCTGYEMIIEAVEDAARRAKETSHE
ncbi:MAG: (2Fe-2S)-binding protein [Pseudomonadota bacterium]|nr:(2Fe-2S)-binding protein [Pseudomonadota bacterium]